MQSTTLVYSASLDGLSLMDGVVALNDGIIFGRDRSGQPSRVSMRLIKVTFTSEIPNIFSAPATAKAPAFSNNVIYVSNDGGTNWTDITLGNGVYTMPYIQEAINTAVSNWWKSSSDPGIVLRYNLATHLTYVKLDSSKLAVAGQLAIDFSRSRIWEVLGYEAVKTFTTDGSHVADAYAHLNWFGDSIALEVTGFGPLTRRNGVLSETVCTIPLTTATVGNEYIYPNPGGTLQPIELRPIERLTRFEVHFLGRDRMPVYVMQGDVEVELLLTWT